MGRIVSVEGTTVVVRNGAIIVFEQPMADSAQAAELVKVLEDNPESSVWECFGVFLRRRFPDYTLES